MSKKRLPNPHVPDPHVLDVTQFADSPSHDLAVVVHRETEAERSSDARAFKAAHPDLPPPSSEPRGLLDLLDGPIDSSQWRHWGEYAMRFNVLLRCQEALGLPIGAVAKRIALELGPPNGDELFWMGAWLLALDEKTDLEFQMQQQRNELEQAKETQRQNRRRGGLAKNAKKAEAKRFVLAEWAQHKDAYDANRTSFARDYVRRVKRELDVDVSEKTISVNWLGGL